MPSSSTDPLLIPMLRAMARSPQAGPLPPFVLNDLDRLIQKDPRCLTERANDRSRITLAERVGQHNLDAAQVWCLDWPLAYAPMVRGALKHGHLGLALRLLTQEPSRAPWHVLDDPDVRARFCRALVEQDRPDALLAWQAAAPHDVRQELERDREHSPQHLVSLTLRRRRERVLTLALNLGLSVEAHHASPRYQGSTLLHRVAYYDWHDGVVAVAEHGADLNAINQDGRSPLLLATMYGKWHAALALVNLGANVHLAGRDGKQALWHACTYRTPAGPPMALIHALVEAGADRFTPQGKTTKALSPWGWLKIHAPSVMGALNASIEQRQLRATLAQLADTQRDAPLPVHRVRARL